MSLEAKSKQLKNIVEKYDTAWFLGEISETMKSIGRGWADESSKRLSSPLRQLFYIGGLLISSPPIENGKKRYSEEEWNQIVDLVIEIEMEYDKIFYPKETDVVDDHWTRARKVTMSSFLGYFNQGPLNYLEQSIEWIQSLFSKFDGHLMAASGLNTADFLLFYDTLDDLMHKNFDAFLFGKSPVKTNWEKYASVKLVNTAPAFLGFEVSEKEKAMFHFMADKGIANRFFQEELASGLLPIEKVIKILAMLSCERKPSEFLYYTSNKPGNPLNEKPIIKLSNNMYQVFDIKQVIHAIQEILESLTESNAKYQKHKGSILENKVVSIFRNFLKADYKEYHKYYVDGCEQDTLFLWKNYAFIIEAKGYRLREPLRNPEKAFSRIKDDFRASIGYAYEQTQRVEKKFRDQQPLIITDKYGKTLDTIDTTKYDSDFSIIVNLESFGAIQNDLSLLLQLESEEDLYPWVIKLDDLEVFLLTLQAHKMDGESLVDYLLLRDKLHGRLLCMDELEVCGAFIEGLLNEKEIEGVDTLQMSPDNVDVFEKQYVKGMGFKNEKLWKEKKGGRHIFI